MGREKRKGMKQKDINVIYVRYFEENPEMAILLYMLKTLFCIWIVLLVFFVSCFVRRIFGL